MLDQDLQPLIKKKRQKRGLRAKVYEELAKSKGSYHKFVHWFNKSFYNELKR